MASNTPSNNPHISHRSKWPIILNCYLEPARGSTNQYEFHCSNKHNAYTIDSKLPLIPGNPYQVTVSQCKGKRKHGIPVPCIFRQWTVIGQFHRHPPSQRNKRIWIYTDYSNRGIIATEQWHKFISYFGITVGHDDTQIPVYLEFHPDPKIVIRLRQES